MIRAKHAISGLLASGLLIALVLGLSNHARAGLVAEYTFDNPGNRLADSVATGGYQDGTNGASSSAVSFVASDPSPPTQGTTVAQFDNGDYFTVPDSVHLAGNNLSFTALVKVAAGTSTWDTVMSANGMLRFQYCPSRITIGFLDEGSAMHNYYGDDFPSGEWVFLAMRIQVGADKKGHLVEAFSEPVGLTTPLSATTHFSVTTPDTWTVDLANMAGFHVGRNVSGIGSADYLDGKMDRVRFYDHYLSDTELDSLYLSYTIPEPSTLLLFPLGIGLLWLARRRRR